MGDKWEKEARKPVKAGMSNKSSSGKASVRSTGIYTYHPTKEAKEVISASYSSIEGALEILASWLEQGCKLSIGYAAERSSYFIILREPGEFSRDALALSAWHTELCKCFGQLAYYLKHVNDQWPDIGPTQPFDNEW